MSKVLTVRIGNELYKQLKSPSMPPTRELITNALTEFLSKLNDKTETKVYGAYTPVNIKENENKYQRTVKEIDAFLSDLEALNEKS
jgi:hypothetical protein